MTISEYKLKRDTFRAPKINIGEGEFQSYFTFQKGQSILGYVDDSTGIKLVITENAYAIPLSSLTFVRDIEIDGEPVDYSEDGEAISQSGSITNDPKKIEEEAKKAVKDAARTDKPIEIPKEYREQMDKIKNTDIVNSIVKKSRNSVNGMIIGGIAGLVIAIATRQPKFGFMVLGTIGGGLVGYGVSGDAKKAAPKPDTKKDKTDTKKTETDGKGKKD